MARSSLAALALVLVPAATGRGAYGQALPTSTPTPVASPAPTSAAIPSGRTLIELMRKAMVARRTLRVSITSQTTWPGHAVLGWTWMDLDLRTNAMREVDTIERVRPNAPSIAITVERRELVVSGGEGAWRTPGRPWSCERLNGVRVRSGLVPFQIQAAAATNLGPGNVAGTPVWHVEAINATGSTTVDLYIARSDDTLVRLNLNTTDLPGVTTHHTDTETYGRYGKAIAVKVPLKCR